MPTAFVGTLTRGSGKPVIGIIAEFDALPNGHSCGHNLFGAGSVSRCDRDEGGDGGKGDRRHRKALWHAD